MSSHKISEIIRRADINKTGEVDYKVKLYIYCTSFLTFSFILSNSSLYSASTDKYILQGKCTSRKSFCCNLLGPQLEGKVFLWHRSLQLFIHRTFWMSSEAIDCRQSRLRRWRALLMPSPMPRSSHVIPRPCSWFSSPSLRPPFSSIM